MNISKKCHEIVRIVTWFTLETILEQMTNSAIFLVVVKSITSSYRFHDLSQRPILFAEQKMYVVRHQTIGIDMAGRSPCYKVILQSFLNCRQYLDEHPVVIWLFKDVLPVDAS